MPRYFFDIQANGHVTSDDEGTELPDFDTMRREARAILPAIALHEVSNEGDRQAFTVHVTDEDGQSVYAATMNLSGLRLNRR